MIIAVSGNIGAGKTTLVSQLSVALGYRAEYEAVVDNPYLHLFYKDMKRWSFPLQVFFLSHRFKQGLSIKGEAKGVILDRTIYEDAHVFAKNLHQTGLMTDIDYQTYKGLYDNLEELIPKPDLLIYLNASPTKLSERVGHRIATGERDFEGKIPVDYLKELNLRYTEWIGSYQHSPLIEVDVDQVDLADESEIEKLLKTIKNHKDAKF